MSSDDARRAHLRRTLDEAAARWRLEERLIAERGPLRAGHMIWLPEGERVAIRWLLLDPPAERLRVVPVDEFPIGDPWDPCLSVDEPFGPLLVRPRFVVEVTGATIADHEPAGDVPPPVLESARRAIAGVPPARSGYGLTPEHTRWLDHLDMVTARLKKRARKKRER